LPYLPIILKPKPATVRLVVGDREVVDRGRWFT
jgi:hypothetical protein